MSILLFLRHFVARRTPVSKTFGPSLVITPVSKTFVPSFVITPVSPHNLSARPMIVPDDSEITFKIEGRSKKYLISLDSRFWPVNNTVQLTLRKADFRARLIRLAGNSYFKTIRQKLSWGLDIRN